ncbi:melatonin receptor type 1A-like [Stylophora pistillata]|uniref:melatonin receptor type 1A-like n=1 Tax=Stylophora pistillata TaxID=50429 RepID=UPI000C03991A|nr:melatonin receptor type 1A-like [Stylophora pistillata]
MEAYSVCNTSCRVNDSRGEFDETGYEDIFFPWPLIVALSFICLLITAVNGLVIILIHKKKTLRTLTNMFLTSLAISDLLSGLVGIPLALICLTSSTRDILIVCVLSTIFIRFTAISSVCHVLLIACDRYIFIVHQMKYHSLVSNRRGIAATVVIWLIAFAASTIQTSWHSFDEEALTTIDNETESIDIKYSLTCLALFFAFPMIMICYIYGNIFYISLKRHQTDRKLSKDLRQRFRSRHHEWRGRSVLSITLLIFAGCWLPYFLMVLYEHTESFHLPPLPLWVNRLLVFLSFVPAVSNPVLCTLTKKDFRQAFKEVVLRRERSYLSDTKLNFHVASQ